MSHIATNWAFEQPTIHRDMKPGEWAVLMVLADCHNPLRGCFPSQEFICDRTNLAERAVRDQLTRLRERGLVIWDEAREHGRRGSNRYCLAFEPGFQPAKSAGSSTGKIEQEQPADSDSFNRQNLPPNLVREPVREPLREGVRENAGEDRKKIEQAFWRLAKIWPNLDGLPKDRALAAWAALSAEERAEAERKFPDWLVLLKANGKKHTPGPTAYFGQKLWKDVPDAPPEAAKPIEAPVFGPVWGGMRMRTLILDAPQQGPKAPPVIEAMMAQNDAAGRRERMARQARYGWPKVNALHERALNRRGVVIDPRFEFLKDLMEPVPVESSVYAAWKAEHDRQGWPWIPDPGGMRVVWFPKGGPGGLDAFEAALRRNEGQGDDGDQSQAAE